MAIIHNYSIMAIKRVSFLFKVIINHAMNIIFCVHFCEVDTQNKMAQS